MSAYWVLGAQQHKEDRKNKNKKTINKKTINTMKIKIIKNRIRPTQGVQKNSYLVLINKIYRRKAYVLRKGRYLLHGRSNTKEREIHAKVCKS